jgi:uncharacterized phiE125 gp8 family phage protein
MNISITTDITSEPVSIEEVKQRVGYRGDNSAILDELSRMQVAARELCENYTNYALGVKVIEVYYEEDYDMDLERKTLKVPLAPVNSITSVTSVNIYGTETVLTLDTYYYIRGGKRKEIYIPEITSFGILLNNKIIGWKVVANVGYTPITIPKIFKEAILKLVWDWYNAKGNYVPQLTDQVRLLLSSIGDKS